MADAEKHVLSMLKKHTPRSSCPLAGNSVHMDRLFLSKYMPGITDHVHYRIVDISSLSELCQRWLPGVEARRPHHASAHRALGDVQASIATLIHYRKFMFVPPPVSPTTSSFRGHSS
jgi:oligoribonuclease